MLATDAADEADGLADLEAVYEAAEAADDSDLEMDSAATEATDEALEAEELNWSAYIRKGDISAELTRR